MATKHFAWSNIYNGGEVKNVTLPNGGVKRVVTKRNVIAFGDEVSKSKSKLKDEEWDALIESKVIRDYAPPAGLGEDESPSSFIQRGLLAGELEFDPNLLLELSLKHAESVGAEAEEEEVSELAEV